MTVGEQTLARLEQELAGYRKQLATESDARWVRLLEGLIADCQRRIHEALTWVDSPMGRAEVQL